jgi:spermidine/putrescine transport system ATP-binding protein
VKIHGTDLLVGVRPEQLEIGAEKPEGYDGYLQGEVSDVAFYGESVHYHIRAAGLDETIAVAVPNYFHTVDHKRGDTVWLGVQNASVIDLGAQQNQ